MLFAFLVFRWLHYHYNHLGQLWRVQSLESQIMHIELIGGSVHIKNSDDVNVVLTASELIELVYWAIHHEVELHSKAWEAEVKFVLDKKQLDEPLEGISGI